MLINAKEVFEMLKKQDEALTIVVGNQKGGSAKTTNTYMISYTLAKFGIKTLAVDLDPQSNLTKTLMLTKSHESKEVNTIDKTLMRGIQEKNLEDLPVTIMDNLDLLPSYIDFEDFAKFIYSTTKTDYQESHVLEPLFKPLKSKYQIIIMDLPPFSIEVTRNACVMADYVLLSLQTQDDSLTGAETYIDTLAKLKAKYNLAVEVLGILPALTDKRGSVDKMVLASARQEFGEENMFKTIIPQMARVKRFPIKGISTDDYFDRAVTDKYEAVTNEFLERLKNFEESKESGEN